MTVADVISQHANVNGKQENSSLTLSKYLFGEEGNGPLKLMLRCSNDTVALISGTSWGL